MNKGSDYWFGVLEWQGNGNLPSFTKKKVFVSCLVQAYMQN
jgi:hypothetical protein